MYHYLSYLCFVNFFQGGNISKDSLNGGVIEKISSFVGDKLHKCFGIDPSTGKVIGAIAGNVIFHLGGKDNKLGGIGKVILDNIVSGKSQRKVIYCAQFFYFKSGFLL